MAHRPREDDPNRADAIWIYDLQRGQAPAGLQCPDCGGGLTAVLGERMAHHFRHARDAKCARAGETALHLYAKALLEKTGRLFIPRTIKRDGGELKWVNSRLWTFDEVKLEERQGSFVPDVMLRSGDAWLIVEIFVTHKVDEAKRQRIAAAGVSAMEIDLSDLREFRSIDKLDAAILRDSKRRKWLHNSPLARKVREYEQQERQKKETNQRQRYLRMVALADAFEGPGREPGDIHLACLERTRERLDRIGHAWILDPEKIHGEDVLSEGAFSYPSELWRALVVDQFLLSANGHPLDESSILPPIKLRDAEEFLGLVGALKPGLRARLIIRWVLREIASSV